jgi:DNA polymerase-3 subunit delta'
MRSVLGQPKAISVIERAIEDGRKHHAWIFYGPRGVGKFTTALQFAKIIINQPETNSVHPDIHIICKEDVVWSQNPALQRRKQTNIPIDLLREKIIGGKTSDDRVHDSVAFKTPVSGTQKVFIIDEAELLDEQGQNALLKTLEEPPVNTTIILVTCRDDLLLPTIRSRCMSVAFSRLEKEFVESWASDSGLDVSPSDLAWAIDFSDGSPGLVCEAVETDLCSVANSISVFINRQDVGNYSKVALLLINFIDTVVAKKLKQNSSASKESANRRVVELLLLLFSRSAQKLIRSDRLHDGIAAAKIVSDVEGQLSTNISIKVLIESLCARWASLPRTSSVFV